MNKINDVEIQRQYYSQMAGRYEEMHGVEKEHDFALSLLISSLDYLNIQSVLDIGCGTGRAIRSIKKQRPDIRIVGIEPVAELRAIGHSLGLSSEELIDGDATNIKFNNSEFDLVSEFGVLHHIPKPECAVAEMLRVARRGIFISDSNNFGQGSAFLRAVKQTANTLGLWSVFDWIKTKGKGFSISEGDGLFYSYSVFNNYNQIRSSCESIHILNTGDGGINPYRTASHVCLLALKK